MMMTGTRRSGAPSRRRPRGPPLGSPPGVVPALAERPHDVHDHDERAVDDDAEVEGAEAEQVGGNARQHTCRRTRTAATGGSTTAVSMAARTLPRKSEEHASTMTSPSASVRMTVCSVLRPVRSGRRWARSGRPRAASPPSSSTASRRRPAPRWGCPRVASPRRPRRAPDRLVDAEDAGPRRGTDPGRLPRRGRRRARR